MSSIVLSPSLGWYLVERKPFLWRFMWPFSVYGDVSGKYFRTALAVRPGHVDSCLFLITLSKVAFVGLKRAWCRYLMSDALDLVTYALLAQ